MTRSDPETASACSFSLLLIMEATNSYSRAVEELRTNREIEDAAIDHLLRLEAAAGRHAVDTRGAVTDIKGDRSGSARAAQIFGSRPGNFKRLKPTQSASTS